MIFSLTDLLRIAVTTFLPTITLASQSFLTPIPQDLNYKALASGQIFGGNFSTEVTHLGRVAGDIIGSCSDTADNDGNSVADCADQNCFGPIGCDPLGIEAAPAKLKVELIRTPTCVLSGDLLTYKIVITNEGGRSAVDIETQNQHPIMPISNVERPMDKYIAAKRLMIWREPILAPGDTITYSFQIPHVLDRVRDDLTVIYFDRLSPNTKIGPIVVHTYDFAADPCSPPIAGESPPIIPFSPLPDAQPFIICDPSEASCVPSRPAGLGLNFQNAKSPLESPSLGPRFQEAIADIIPGECRVIPDDIIATPEYQDSLNRRAEVSAFYIRPLYNSGEDFKKLVQENVLLNMKNFSGFEDQLRVIYDRQWQKQSNALKKVANKELSTNDIRSQINDWVTNWSEETKAAQQSLAITYSQAQKSKKAKFDPLAQQALANAKQSVANACPRKEDDGLEPLLPAVKKAYENSLTIQSQAFNHAQQIFLNPNSQDIPQSYRASSWQNALNSALAAFDQGNKQPLDDYILSIPTKSQKGFQAIWDASYKKQQQGDEAANNQVRLNDWEKALDTPKAVATDCQKEKDFSYQVATTWCESGTYPERLLRGAPVPAKVKTITLPDTRSLNGKNTTIDSNSVLGQACSKEPGDPWWASDCSCECGDLVPRDGPDPEHPIFVPCESARQITRHDYYVTTQAECLNELRKETEKDTFPPF